MTYRLRNIGIAVALALVAGLLTVFYVTNYKRDVRSAETNVTVYVAAKDIPAGTPGDEVISDGYLDEQDVAKRSVTPGAISSPEQLDSLVAGGTIYAGEQVTTRRFTTEEEKGIRAQLTGTRARGLDRRQQAADPRGHAQGRRPRGRRRELERARGGCRTTSRASSSATSSCSRHRRARRTNEKLTDPSEGGNPVMLALTDAQSQKMFWIAQNGAWIARAAPARQGRGQPEQRRVGSLDPEGRPRRSPSSHALLPKKEGSNDDGRHPLRSRDAREGPRLRDRRLRGPRGSPRGARASPRDRLRRLSRQSRPRPPRALRGGHLAVVLHGTRSSTLPEAELASIREHTTAPIILLASGEASMLLEEALEAGRRRRPAPAADDREPRLRDPQGEPFRPHGPRAIPAAAAGS